MGEFIGEFLIDLVLAPLFSFLLSALWLVVRVVVLLALYPLMLGTGWLRLWLRERGRRSLAALWRAHGMAGLHRFGWQEAALDGYYLLVTLLVLLAGTGLGLVLYFTSLNLSL